MPIDTVVANNDVAARAPHFRYLDWGPVIGGAIGTAAIAFVLYTFGSALGLSAVSAEPYRGLSGPTFFIVVTLYAALVQVVAYAAGGYLAGRMRMPWLGGSEGERHFRDGAHGFAVWALGTIVTVAVIASGASGALKTAIEATSTVSAGATMAATNAGDGGVSLRPADRATDLLLHPGPDGAPEGRVAADRGPIVRTFVANLGSEALSERDRAYLARTVARQTGLPQAEAETRVDEAFAEARAAEQRIRQAAEETRKKSALAAFITAATLAIACAAACVAAGLGARDRDARTAAYWMGATRFW
ncbi:MAG: hypothetical protein KIT25_10360 [Enhydrobacter sp.]|nr:MAG: hypothetical protein KIT25_10360 [Enhydrobacter sp.]